MLHESADHRTIRKTLVGFRRGAFALFRFSAFMTAIRASISGPLQLGDEQQRFHRDLPVG